mmetsp:Transcript_8613/g.18517  ORF Transcript_8613/g.18517 Transcript_8613/m.18517 type:complete len:266 (-) Transcript_8613:1057-1854(-)
MLAPVNVEFICVGGSPCKGVCVGGILTDGGVLSGISALMDPHLVHHNAPLLPVPKRYLIFDVGGHQGQPPRPQHGMRMHEHEPQYLVGRHPQPERAPYRVPCDVEEYHVGQPSECADVTEESKGGYVQLGPGVGHHLEIRLHHERQVRSGGGRGVQRLLQRLCGRHALPEVVHRLPAPRLFARCHQIDSHLGRVERRVARHATKEQEPEPAEVLHHRPGRFIGLPEDGDVVALPHATRAQAYQEGEGLHAYGVLVLILRVRVEVL